MFILVFTRFGPVLGAFLMDYVYCAGKEASLLQCSHSTSTSTASLTSYNRMYGAGVTCVDTEGKKVESSNISP